MSPPVKSLKDIKPIVQSIFKATSVQSAWVFEDFANLLFPSDTARVAIYVRFRNNEIPDLNAFYDLEEILEKKLGRGVLLTTTHAIDYAPDGKCVKSEAKLIYKTVPKKSHAKPAETVTQIKSRIITETVGQSGRTTSC